ncbi:MAG TPA: hypothetical protein VHD56_16945 [Tepidisphaeraceae bacterium]|nr:hypothetical protein [Tepidisphaeraceae bacterium]
MAANKNLSARALRAAHRTAVANFAVAAVPPVDPPEVVYELVLAAIYYPWSVPGTQPPVLPPGQTLEITGYSSTYSLKSLAIRLNGAFARWRIDVSVTAGDLTLKTTIRGVFAMIWKKLNA